MIFTPVTEPIKPAITATGKIIIILLEISILLKQSNSVNSITVSVNVTAIPKNNLFAGAKKLPVAAPVMTDIPDEIRINMYKYSDGMKIFNISNDETARRITKIRIPAITEYNILLSIVPFDLLFVFTPEDIKNPSVSVKRYEGI